VDDGLFPRLPEQPIFYPVLGEGYAIQIARDWNTRNDGTGYVLSFQVQAEYVTQFPVQTASLRVHRNSRRIPPHSSVMPAHHWLDDVAQRGTFLYGA
jgi:hypothetical protein